MTRRLFGTDGIRGTANRFPITPELVLRLGKAIALHLEKKTEGKGKTPRVVIGKDTRVSGYMLETALTSGLVSMGAEVFLAGPIPTPAVSFLVHSLSADAGIVISASHNPAEDNGIKIFDSSGYKLSDADEHGIERILFSEGLHNGLHDGRSIGKAFRLEDSQQRYREFAKSTMEKANLQGIKAVIDCANGAAYKVAPQILSELGADVVAIGNKPDGFNINSGCGATNLVALSQKVIEERADIGIALDGDADRVIVIDENGSEVNGDRIMACLALDFNEKGRLAKNTVVTTHMSNAGFEAHLRQAGLNVIRVNVGDRYVIEEMRAKGYNFGGEQSGHIINGDFSTTGDGILTALQFMRLVKEKGMRVSELANTFGLYPQVLLNVRVRHKKPLDEMAVVIEDMKKAEVVLSGEGRIIVRYSGTENLCRIMVEGKSEEEINSIANSIAEKIRGEIGEQ